MSGYRWPAVRVDDGADVTLQLSGGNITEYTEGPPPPPPPGDDVVPADTTTVTLGGDDYPLAGIDPTAPLPPETGIYPGFRGTNQLVAYTAASGPATVTNHYGVEVQIDADRAVLAVNDRLATGSTTGTAIPADGAVLSGHDQAADFLRGATIGEVVEFSTRSEPPPPPPSSGPGNTSTWYMIWGDSPAVHVNTKPAIDFDEVRLAFSNDRGNPIVGNGPFGLATLQSELQHLVSLGKRVSLSFGGGGYTTDSIVNDVAGVVAAAEDRLQVPIGGINWDDERHGFQINKAIRQSRTLKNARGDGFYVSWSPDGTTKWLYRDALINAPDVVDELAFQCYYTGWGRVEVDTVFKGFLRDGKLSSGQLGLGMMTGDSSVWSLAECKRWAQYAHDTYECRKFFLWEFSRNSTQAWVDFMNALKA
jgi:hypothetical protein